jgi:hypothetical protein
MCLHEFFFIYKYFSGVVDQTGFPHFLAYTSNYFNNTTTFPACENLKNKQPY